MINVRYSNDRGLTKLGWLTSRHTFSFDTYNDALYQRFRVLRVINQDIVQPGQGFSMHSHRNMEIITYILKGAVVHRDSIGNEGIIRAGEIQRMTAGSGVAHSEFNASEREPLELLQIWIFPEQLNLEPGYQQIRYDAAAHGLQLLANSRGGNDLIKIHQDVKLYRGQLEAGQQIDYTVLTERHVWIQLISGRLAVNGINIEEGDGVAVSDLGHLSLSAITHVHFLLFDLP